MEQTFDRAEVERLVNTYSDLILRVSYTYLNNTHDAQDICQTVFLKLLTGNRQFRSPEHEKAWMIRTTINACKDLLGSAWHSRTCGIEACAEVAAPEVEDGSLLAAVNMLPEKYRLVIYLHYYEGYSAREIAAMLGENAATVGTRLFRGRKQLKSILGGETV
ncbi:MAG: sigma-70 family RNA polymerase sigma factor [Butyricicoccus sp.]|nr:sigma-70 family RNA polymerase sigma factor [Butyricicoccus sp.]